MSTVLKEKNKMDVRDLTWLARSAWCASCMAVSDDVGILTHVLRVDVDEGPPEISGQEHQPLYHLIKSQ